MEMEVRCFLSTEDPVVLKRKYSEGAISLDERFCDPLGRGHYSPAFLVRKIEQRRDMPTCDNATLANFELPGIDHGECMFAFIYDRPSFFATGHPFTKVARLSYGKFDQCPLRFNRQVGAKNACGVRFGQPVPVSILAVQERDPVAHAVKSRSVENRPWLPMKSLRRQVPPLKASLPRSARLCMHTADAVGVVEVDR
jgi:hypothetical protein